MIGGTEKEFFAIPNNLMKLDGLEAGKMMMSSKTNLSRDDKSAVIDAAAKNIEQKEHHSEDLKGLIEKFDVSEEEILARIISRHINELLS